MKVCFVELLGLVNFLNRLMSLVGDVCVNELRDAIAGAPRGVNVCDTRGI